MHTSERFKKTKIGTIPVDWEMDILANKASIKRGAGSQYLNYVNDSSNSIRLIRITDFLGDDIKYVEKTKDIERFTLKKGDLLIAGTGATAGITFEVPDEFVGLAYSYNAPRIRCNKAVDKKFILYALKSGATLRQQHSLFTGNAQPFLDTRAIGSFKLLIPPLPEQHKIAEILSTWDQAISTTQKLIDEIKLRNKGLAQQLLTGKKRLKGFQEDWKAVLLGEIFTEIKEANDGAENHHIMTISSTLGLITQESKFDRIIAGDSLKKYTLLQKGDFAYNKGNSKTYPMGCIYQLQKESALVPFVYICFRPSNKVSPDFYSFWFLENGLDRQLKKIITSGARGDGLLNVSKKDFFNLIAPYPSKEEQTAIASVLSEAEKELKLHQKQLDNLKEQKKGLMQKLLTGEIRTI